MSRALPGIPTPSARCTDRSSPRWPVWTSLVPLLFLGLLVVPAFAAEYAGGDL